MVRISKAKQLAKRKPIEIQFPEACPITRLKSPSGRIFTELRQEDIDVLLRLGWTYAKD